VVSGQFLAVDWGTTNRRVFVIADGVAIASERDARGAAAVSDFPADVADIRARFGDLPLLLAGMVGSNIGWQMVPYVAAPAGLAELAAQVARIDARTFIVPGLSFSDAGRADVMRGEEVQLLGAAASGLVPPDARLCQPGTHCKWATLADGRVASFTTAMTGELFALLRGHGLLACQLGSEVDDGAAFRAGVAEGARRDLAASLFGVRANGILGRREDCAAAAFVSGLLIGADVVVRLAESAAPVYILADPVLGRLYAGAITELGGESVAIDSHAAFIAGITWLWDLLT
jgi:2-dehydro-3-deoxygalactonokinase